MTPHIPVPNPHVGEAIRIARKKAMLNQAQLSKRLDLSARMVGYFETDERTVPIELLPALSEALGVAEDWFLNFHPRNIWAMPIVLTLVDIDSEDKTPFHRPEVWIYEGDYLRSIAAFAYPDCDTYDEALALARSKVGECLGMVSA
jgi:transcriptional regulator with XRE-family HTH domain